MLVLEAVGGGIDLAMGLLGFLGGPKPPELGPGFIITGGSELYLQKKTYFVFLNEFETNQDIFELNCTLRLKNIEIILT